MQKIIISFLALLSITTGAAKIASAAGSERPDYVSSKLSGNWSGKRDELFNKGYSFDIYYKADVWRNFSGGTQQGNRALDNLDMKMTVDGEKAFNMKGSTFFLYFLNNDGGHPNNLAGTNGGIDNIETTTHAFKLYEAWAQQNFWDDKVSVLAGLHDLNSEFYVTDTSGIFLNPTYGIGTEMAATGDNGPSIFPTTSMAARLSLQPVESTYIKGAIFDGVPGNAHNPKGTHIDFHNKDGALLVTEGGFKNDNVGHFAFGGWEYTTRRADQVTPANKSRSRGVYFLADKSFYKQGYQDISAFARLGYTAGDVEQFRRNWSLGIVASGFVPSRKDGQIGLAISSNSNSSKFKIASGPVNISETQIELTYKDMLMPWLSIQPDLQYTINPGTNPALDNAATAGIRLGVDF